MAGLRERKKQQTRQRISDIATGLLLERGFDSVTIAEIAEAADVSVNTVYNYFPSKEDLFFDREGEVVERPSLLVRERGPGESAAHALLSRLRADLEQQTGHVGLSEGFDRFMRCVRESPQLIARVSAMQARIVGHLAETLREEAGAAPEDPTPEVIASQLTAVNNEIFRTVTLGLAREEERAEVVRRALTELDVAVSLLSDRVLNYATRAAE